MVKHMPSSETFDIHIFHEGDLTPLQLEKIETFQTYGRPLFVHRIVFEIPSHIDLLLVQKRIDLAQYHYQKAFRDVSYRNMCSFYAFYVYDLFLEWGYTRLMRLDDDSFLLESTTAMFSHPFDYVYRLTQHEDEAYMLYFSEWIQQYCHDRKYTTGAVLKTLTTREIVFNNFFIVHLPVYQDPEVRHYLEAVYSSGGIYYCRWGDALIQTVIWKLWTQRWTTHQVSFAYGKWGYVYPNVQSHESYMAILHASPNQEQPQPTRLVILIILGISLILVMCILFVQLWGRRWLADNVH